MKVKAVQRGYFGKLREVGDVFTIKNEKQLGSWMKPVEKSKDSVNKVKPLRKLF